MATSKNSDTLALVVDGNVTSRSLLSAQLRDYGVTKVVQCSRVQDARIRLEHTVFDYVLCDQYFHDTQSTGQTLLDDLRRAQLLPFSTVFFMVTTEATYAAVAEAAESALDGYLLKPFTPLTLFERLSAARPAQDTPAPHLRRHRAGRFRNRLQAVHCPVHRAQALLAVRRTHWVGTAAAPGAL